MEEHYLDNSPNSPTSLLFLMASTSTQIDVFSDGVINAVKNGEESALKVLIQLKAMELATERIKKEIRDNYLTEAEKYSGSEFEFLGNKIVKGDVKTEYDFTSCGDPTYQRLETEFDNAKNKLEERKAFLKTIKSPTPIGDTVTGELTTVNPAIKRTTAGLKISIR